MAMEANIMPSRKATAGMTAAQGEGTSWKAAAMARITVPVISDRVAPQKRALFSRFRIEQMKVVVPGSLVDDL